MTIEEVHYDFKMKMNKTDSQNYRNLLIPEVDWLVNESIELYVKMVVHPRIRNHFGFEIGQRTIDDIRTLVVTPKSNHKLSNTENASIINVNDNRAQIPLDD